MINTMTEENTIVKLPFANGNHPRTEAQKQVIIDQASAAYEVYMDALGFDWRSDPNSADTPMRVAKAFVNDLAVGCYDKPPKITAFDNIDNYDGLVFQGNITMHSFCSHHHLPFIGFAHVGYIPGRDGKVIGLSKLNRIVEWFCRRPQIQENLTMQIHKHIDKVCEGNKGVAVMVEANHMCACVRGVKHDSVMKTARMSGAFLDKDDVNTRQEFYDFVRDLK
jgi:GTP cyclohydrolase I|tara:strand:+ start:9799 stop:10464 length:666 start_codon:yes stop_codon:yes gene_type:complete